VSEDVAATPGWVEARLDEILAALPAPVRVACRSAYLDCLARCRPPANVEAGHDRCRAVFLDCLAGAGLDRPALQALEPELEALEAEIAENT
jgi:hypothetical protein